MAFDGANVERSFGADDQEVSRAFLFSDVGEGLVVALVAVLEGMDESRIFPEKDPEEGEQLVGLFHIAFGLGEDDDVPVIANALKEAHRNGISGAAVGEGIAIQLYEAGEGRHGGGSPHPLNILGISF